MTFLFFELLGIGINYFKPVSRRTFLTRVWGFGIFYRALPRILDMFFYVPGCKWENLLLKDF